MQTISLKNKKKMRNTLFITFLILLLLLSRICYIEFIQGKELQVLAYEQQVQKRTVNPRRGTIYDSSEKYTLAISSTAYTVSVNPTNIPNEKKELIAKKLTEIFDLDYETVLKKVSKRSSIETIVKKIEKDKADELRIWLLENNIDTGVNIDEDSKRYYPYSNLASQVIGFCGGDNQGWMKRSTYDWPEKNKSKWDSLSPGAILARIERILLNKDRSTAGKKRKGLFSHQLREACFRTDQLNSSLNL